MAPGSSTLLIAAAFQFLLYQTSVCANDEADNNDLTSLPGHLKPFGEGGPSSAIAELEGFPDPLVFFDEYVKTLTPVVMRQAAIISPAFHLWTDDYLANVEDPSTKTKLLIEAKKKENRSEPTFQMTLKEFLGIYNKSDIYLVEGVPTALGKDVVLPCPLQCSGLYDYFVDKKRLKRVAGKQHIFGPMFQVNNRKEVRPIVDTTTQVTLTQPDRKNIQVMWFSSGGTKSVVHTDSVENINCLYRGEKKLVFVDPKYRDKVDIDRPEGSYSSVDVDSVDYTKFPGLAEVEFRHVEMKAGDCLYIPYLWVHQVRSYGSNLAVNVWFNHYAVKNLDLNTCQKCDKTLTLDKLTFNGFNQLLDTLDHVKDGLYALFTTKQKALEPEEFMDKLLGEDYRMLKDSEETYHIQVLTKIFRKLDINKDNHLTKEDLDNASEETWKKVHKHYTDLSAFLDDVFGAPEDQPEAEVEGGEQAEHIREEL